VLKALFTLSDGGPRAIVVTDTERDEGPNSGSPAAAAVVAGAVEAVTPRRRTRTVKPFTVDVGRGLPPTDITAVVVAVAAAPPTTEVHALEDSGECCCCCCCCWAKGTDMLGRGRVLLRDDDEDGDGCPTGPQ
jgi:hypothetical protein